MRYLLYIAVIMFLLIIGGGCFHSQETQIEEVTPNEQSSLPKTDVHKKQIDGSSYISEIYDIETDHITVAQPDIYQGKVIWSGGKERTTTVHSALDLYYYDIKKDRIELVAESIQNGQIDEGQMNKEWICWTDWSDVGASDWKIFAHSRSDNTTKMVAQASDATRYESMELQLPRLTLSDNDYLSWFEPVNSDKELTFELKLLYLPTNTIETIASVNTNTAIPHLSKKYLVWSELHNIYVYSLDSGEIIKEIKTTKPVNYPKVNDEYIVWQEKDSSGSSTLFLKLINSDEEPLEIFQGGVFFYDIGDEYVIWESNRSIYVYSIKNHAFGLLDDAGLLPYIRGNEVVWEVWNHEEKRTLRVVKLQ